MALTFIYGNPGSGKSEYIYRRVVKEAAANPGQRFYVLVPEQFTMQTQKRLVEQSARGAILNIDVVSFERLAYRVFDELGIHNTVMEETGKSLILRRIAAEHEKELTVLKRNLKKMGYIDEVKSMISELMQYGISPDELKELSDSLSKNSALQYKLQDILLIYQGFYSYLQDHCVTAEQVPQLLMEAAPESALLREAVLIFDGFTGFTPVQMQLLRRLMHIVKDMYVTVTLDAREALYAPPQIENLFYMSHKMVQSLTKAAVEASFEITEPVFVPSGPNSRLADRPVLRHLEENLFRSRYQVYEGECKEELHITSLLSPRMELCDAAAKISQLVREEGYRYRDFAIVSGNVAQYAAYADSVFDLYDIPYFLDVKREIVFHPLSELIRAALSMVADHFTEESVFRYLRTGLAGFGPEEIDILENYCLERGIHGENRWKKCFLKPSASHRRFREDESRQAEELSVLNQLRERFWQQISTVYEALKKETSTVRERTEVLYQFLTSLQIEEQLRARQEKFEASNEELLAAEYRQIYKIVIDLFDKLVDLLGEEEISLEDYMDILEAGFSSARVGAIPPGNDCLILGDIERTRLDGIRILFFVGVNDGTIPKDGNQGGILSQYDRECLKESDRELAPTAREEVFLQRFYLYLNLTKPADRLYISYSRMNTDGKAAEPSYLIGVLINLFSSLTVEEIETKTPMQAVSPKSGIDAYLSGLYLARRDEILPEWKALHAWYMQHEQWKHLAKELFEANFREFEGEALTKELAVLLYGTRLTNSVTRLELFARCAFAHFLKYGLKLEDRREYTFESLDMGTMFHRILFSYCTRLEKNYSWDTITKEEQAQILNEAIKEAVLALPNESLTETARSAYVLERIRRIMERSVWALTEQIRSGDFRPAGYEVEFLQTCELGDDEKMRNTGQIDRIDTWEEDGKIYVKIIDYKSGEKKFQLLNFYYGMQLQLVVYLNAAMEKMQKEHPDQKVNPAGIFYFHMDDPMVDDTGEADEKIQEAILDAFCLNGLVSTDPDVYLHMDRSLKETTKSHVIPLSLNTNGTVNQRGSQKAAPEAFGLLLDYANEKIRKTAKEILSGDIDVRPYRLNGKDGCTYCDYKGVCGFDRKIAGYQYDDRDKLKENEIWQRISEEKGES